MTSRREEITIKTKIVERDPKKIFSKPRSPLHDNVVEFEVYGDFALFSDPIMKVGGEKFSYQVPTYSALRGVLEGIYFKPTFLWVIDEVRVMNPIQTETIDMKPMKYFSSGNDLSYYTFLYNVRYQVRAHFEWNLNYPQFANDRNTAKHFEIAKRMIRRGGRHNIYLGTSECFAYVEPCKYGSDTSAYDAIPELSFGLMFHSFTYPEEAYSKDTAGMLTAHFWRPTMRNGIIKFERPENCPVHKPIREYPFKDFEVKEETS